MDLFSFFLAVFVVIHSSAIALGVGASTLAITGFLSALGNDGKIDTSERRIMGVVYFSLRVAMGLIFATSLFVWLMDPDFFKSFTMPMWVTIGVLFLNAYVMTKHWISPKLGPAIQAGTWYTLGIAAALYVFDLVELAPTFFWALYAIVLLDAVIIVNLCMQYLKCRRSKQRS